MESDQDWAIMWGPSSCRSCSSLGRVLQKAPMHHASPVLVRGVTTRPDRRVDSRLRGNDGIGGLPDFFSSLLVVGPVVDRIGCDERGAGWHAVVEVVAELAAEELGRVGGVEEPRLAGPVEEGDHALLAGAAVEISNAAADECDLIQTFGVQPGQA